MHEKYLTVVLENEFADSFTEVRLMCLNVSLNIVDLMMYALFGAINMKVGRSP